MTSSPDLNNTRNDDGAPLLNVRGLTVAYGRDSVTAPAVADVDLSIRRGEVVALVGESGSGKSTLAKALIGLLPAAGQVSAGSITFDGRELTGLPDRAFRALRGRRIALVPQDPGASLDPVQTIGSQVVEVFRLHPEGGRRLGGPPGRRELEDRVAELLEQVGIDRPRERLRQYPHELSGGLKQRVLIAMAFALKPDLLIADEPTSALDVTVQSRVLEVFERLAARHGTAVLFVTHDLAVATDRASRIVVMQGGRIREDRSVDAILTAPEDAYTVKLLAEAGAGQRTRAVVHPSPVPVPASAVAPFTPAPPVPALELRNLVKVFARNGEHRAVNDVSLVLRQGTTFALVGESGSGKTTTARLAMRLLDPTSGTVRVAGRDVTRADGRARRELWRSLQLVYQNPDTALDPRLRVGEIIGEPLLNYGVGSRTERRARVAELLDQVNLPAHTARARPLELSGGQRQRVAIARALALGAKTLVLDEALSALDVLTQAQVLDLLQSLQAELGLSYLFISHDLHVVERISDDVGVMQNGQLVETGPTADVFSAPAHPYTRRLLAANPGHRLRRLAGSGYAAPLLSGSQPFPAPVPAR
ncbi:ABC transporter ATP-binding protein [Arthrobacter zhangbolii]|uniref:ABC transporter ATP-binding protein n=1 Tax=Arthrobacter zhangbolii TaxID=2886936 RepID=A0A9X1M803_9MICC|nr:ABC transporter ATP-binding protein [Arthrobacter zhangbolii]MCC3273233.1 ABC transporter ATP-binding protein [Arthrobacter zhangbolii]UON92779.1 ABC transporter ATP-binding protein [Arthrobacter zhangbolii]